MEFPIPADAAYSWAKPATPFGIQSSREAILRKRPLDLRSHHPSTPKPSALHPSKTSVAKDGSQRHLKRALFARTKHRGHGGRHSGRLARLPYMAPSPPCSSGRAGGCASPFGTTPTRASGVKILKRAMLCLGPDLPKGHPVPLARGRVVAGLPGGRRVG